MQMEYDARKKSTALAYLAWFFLGGLGVHRFYLGRTGSGVAQLLLTVFGWFTLPLGIGLFLLIGLGLWLLVDLFLAACRRGNNNQEISVQQAAILAGAEPVR